jgi:hypothetical protein
MGRRWITGIAGGALAGLGYGVVNALVWPLVPGLAAATAAAAAEGQPAMTIIWKVFVFALLAIPGAFIGETRRPR